MEVTVILHSDNTRSVQYWRVIPASEWVEQYTVKEISERQLEAIKDCTHTQIQEILKQFI